MRTLNTVARIRKMAVDEARQVVAVAVHAEQQAADAEAAAEAAIRREQEAATALDAEDAAVEAFAAWLRRGRLAVEQARAATARAQEKTAVARAALSAAMAAQEVVNAVRTEQLAELRRDSARRDQAVIDEIALRPFILARP